MRVGSVLRRIAVVLRWVRYVTRAAATIGDYLDAADDCGTWSGNCCFAPTSQSCVISPAFESHLFPLHRRRLTRVAVRFDGVSRRRRQSPRNRVREASSHAHVVVYLNRLAVSAPASRSPVTAASVATTFLHAIPRHASHDLLYGRRLAPRMLVRVENYVVHLMFPMSCGTLGPQSQ